MITVIKWQGMNAITNAYEQRVILNHYMAEPNVGESRGLHYEWSNIVYV